MDRPIASYKTDFKNLISLPIRKNGKVYDMPSAGNDAHNI